MAISLKIPDNTAYTALAALRRLGVAADRIERSEIRFFDDDGDVESLVRRIESDETIFNPNKHRLTVLDETIPRWGEVWIEPLERTAGPDAVAWRLFDADGAPVDRALLDAAIDRLLCNAAIDRAVTRDTSDRDNRFASE
ncbi:MAG: hypothetical protein JO113_04060 [Candidatus Eremiobacteraeota bacterium]|nr:hypothetical protein [Candidatus Eremiobacteraeota bacterium]